VHRRGFTRNDFIARGSRISLNCRPHGRILEFGARTQVEISQCKVDAGDDVNELPEREIDILTGQPAHGELLADLLQAGPLAPELVLRCAIGIGKALGRVHDRGLVHGSLSPWSIAIGEHSAAILRPRAQDTRAQAYRSPEQVRGEAPGWRSDIFAYGAVLYEMAAGRPAFAGEPDALRTAILNQSPPRPALESPVLKAILPMIFDCLNKDPLGRRQRLQNVVTELKLAARYLTRVAPATRRAAPAAGAGPKPARAASAGETYWLDVFTAEQAARRAKRMRLLGLAAILLTTAAAGILAGKVFFQRRVAGPVLRFVVTAESKSIAPGGVAISPDGRYIAFCADGPEGHRMLWLRALDEARARAIPGTEDAAEPFWSADSRAIGYFAGRSLKIWNMSLAADGTTSGESRVLCPADSTAGGGTWNAAGAIVFAPSLSGGLYRISSSGGELQIVLPLNAAKEHRSYRWPHFLPDGRHFTFLALGANDKANGVYSGDLASGDSGLLFASDSDAIYSGDLDGNPAKFGYLLFVQDGDLYTQGFNPSILDVEGKPELFLRHVGAIETLSQAPLSVSSTGVLAYQTVSPPARQLVWMDREGKQAALLGEPADWGMPRIAPDGRRAVCGKVSPDRHRAELWLLDPDAVSRLVSVPGGDARSPVWSPDGTRIAFTARTGTLFDIYLKALNAPDPAEPLFHSEYTKYLNDWSRDGRYLLFGSFATAGTSSDVWAYSLADRRGGPVVDKAHSESFPSLSPNGRWLAYQSGESGRDEIYVQAFEGISAASKPRSKVSTGGGRMPRWRADGLELFFLAGAGTMMSASVSSAGGDFAFEPPRKLFETRAIAKKSDLYDVSPDGLRLLMNLPYEWTSDSPITVMTNWMQKLRNP
jgi:eukaryotic-like serine/threonine-protein kinase